MAWESELQAESSSVSLTVSLSRLQLLLLSRTYLTSTVVVMFNHLVPQQMYLSGFAKPLKASVCFLKLIMFSISLPEFFFPLSDPYGCNRMICQSLRKFVFCSSCVLHRWKDKAAFQHSCVPLLFHKHGFTLFISAGTAHARLSAPSIFFCLLRYLTWKHK